MQVAQQYQQLTDTLNTRQSLLALVRQRDASLTEAATRTELANRWYDLMDINAGTIATGEETIEDVGLKLFLFILDVASGRKKTFSDQWGLHNQLAVFNPAPVT